ncbi:helix-turn-helix domain-containing protein [Nocardia sp. CA-119907]|uniref:helix-turn-helix domain-containing protein n=1 Tax=Nocardia sp. CA-119907 TaxID=3239973 RepID=UPI003D99E274
MGTPSKGEPFAKVTGNLPRRQLGRYLRDLRQQTGLSIVQASRAIGRGSGTLQRLETGEANRIELDDIEALCHLYDEPKMLPALKGLAQQGNERSWWHEYGDLIPSYFNLYVGLEAAAQQLAIYRPDMVSGLFQTADYARALDRAYFVHETADEIERRVRLRIKRQSLIRRRFDPASVHLILDEAVLRRVVGSPRVMADQLRYLADMPSNVTVQVLPSAAGFPLGISTGPFTILDFGLDKEGQPFEPTVIFVESYTGDIYLERPDSVRRYREAHTALQPVALNVADSKHLLRRVAKEYAP